MKKDFESLWYKLGDIPVNEGGEIEEDFLHFGVGTDREEIWHWFEDEFNMSLGDWLDS